MHYSPRAHNGQRRVQKYTRDVKFSQRNRDTNLFDESREIFHLKCAGIAVIKVGQQTLLVNAWYIHVHVTRT